MAKIKDYFDFCDLNTWKCSICEKEVKARTTSNLLQHFRAHHPNTYEEYVEVAKRPPNATHTRALSGLKKPRKRPIIRHEETTVSESTITGYPPLVHIVMYAEKTLSRRSHGSTRDLQNPIIPFQVPFSRREAPPVQQDAHFSHVVRNWTFLHSWRISDIFRRPRITHTP